MNKNYSKKGSIVQTKKRLSLNIHPIYIYIYIPYIYIINIHKLFHIDGLIYKIILKLSWEDYCVIILLLFTCITIFHLYD